MKYSKVHIPFDLVWMINNKWNRGWMEARLLQDSEQKHHAH